MTDVNKVVLAYSGGLDTSIILRWLKESYGCEVVTFTADLGQGEELGPARRKAELLGASAIFIDELPGGVRARLHLPDVPGERHLRGRVPPRHLDRAPPHRQAAGRDRGRDGGGRDRPRGDRQGQRPGPVRARGLRPSSRDPDHRPLAGVGPRVAREPPRLRRGAPDPHRAAGRQRVPLLDGREPHAHLLRGERARGPVGGAERRDVADDPRAGGRPRPPGPDHPHLRGGRRGGGGRGGDDPRRGDGDPQPAGRRARHRAHRHRRKPLRRHEGAGLLRDPGGHPAPSRPPRDRVPSPSTARSPTSRTS